MLYAGGLYTDKGVGIDKYVEKMKEKQCIWLGDKTCVKLKCVAFLWKSGIIIKMYLS